jgi:hypothetical protein
MKYNAKSLEVEEEEIMKKYEPKATVIKIVG